jgi:hypothetical protein
MGASAQQILQSDPEYLQRQLLAQEQQRVNPTGSAAGALGALLGRGLSNVSQGKGFFQAPDFGLQRVSGVQGIMKSVQFDPNNPAEYYNQVGRALQEAGYADLAPMAFTEARKLQVQERELGVRERQVRGKDDVLSVLTKDGRPAVYDSETNSFKVPDKETGVLRNFDPKKDQLEYRQGAGDPMSALIASIIAGQMNPGGLGGRQPGTPKPPASPKSDSKPKPTTPLDPNAYKM